MGIGFAIQNLQSGLSLPDTSVMEDVRFEVQQLNSLMTDAVALLGQIVDELAARA